MQETQNKYQALINYINQQIHDKKWCSGDKLPSENELSEQFGISRQTVRRALSVLEEEGVVCRIKGSGTYLNFDKTKGIEQKNRIALVTTYVDSYIFPKTIQGIESILFENGYSVQISFTNNTLEREKSILQDIISRDDVAGVIVEGTKSGLPNPNIDLYRQLIRRKVPLLFINTY
ncbi:MAG: GntR family transcriptional regulator, partial [Lachnospiraceae bacterium]|nr:GntR family transcriptional regulator [Lachnospiraceae bacterium]